MPYGDENVLVDASAYAADGMTFRKDMPYRPNPKPWEFYFKHCAVNGNEVFYSKTFYDCSGPYY